MGGNVCGRGLDKFHAEPANYHITPGAVADVKRSTDIVVAGFSQRGIDAGRGRVTVRPGDADFNHCCHG